MKATEQYFLVVPFIIVYKVALTFESVYEILWCDHSNESHWANVTSLAVLSDVVSSFKAFYKMTIWNLAKLTLAISGREKLNPCQDRPTRRVMNYSKKKKSCPRGSEVFLHVCGTSRFGSCIGWNIFKFKNAPTRILIQNKSQMFRAIIRTKGKASKVLWV